MRAKIVTAAKKVHGYGLRWTVQWGLLVSYYLLRSALPRPVRFDERNVYDRPWDVLVLLDACTMDLLTRVAPDYEFLSDVSSIRSVGASSGEWMEKTFSAAYADEMRETVYVTGNPHSDMYLSDDDFLELNEVWTYGWDEELGTIPARPITDRAIGAIRCRDSSRTIVHYMQPHFPAIDAPELGAAMVPDEAGGAWTGSVWDRLRQGEVSRADVEQAYEDNLRYVLDDVRLLLTSVDAERVVISSDHGNAFGEFGMFGHHGYTPLYSLRTVPWCVTEAKDSGRYTPVDHDRTSERDVNHQLDALGYLA